jgi:hypothetical protein
MKRKDAAACRLRIKTIHLGQVCVIYSRFPPAHSNCIVYLLFGLQLKGCFFVERIHAEKSKFGLKPRL